MIVICEGGLSHEGSVGQALAMTDAAAAAGANAIKWQNHTGDPVREFRPGFVHPQDATRADQWARTAFTPDQWRKLSDRAHERGLLFGVSVFSRQAIDQMSKCTVDLWKLGSGNTTNHPLIVALAGQWGPLVISSGMSTWPELDAAVDIAIETEKKHPTGLRPSPIVMQATSIYPCPPEKVGLNILPEIRRRYPGCPVGLSDHSRSIVPGICAAREGASYLEVHVTWHRECFGSDVPSSLTIDELRQLVEGVRFVERMKPVDKNELAGELTEMRRIFAGIK